MTGTRAAGGDRSRRPAAPACGPGACASRRQRDVEVRRRSIAPPCGWAIGDLHSRRHLRAGRRRPGRRSVERQAEARRSRHASTETSRRTRPDGGRSAPFRYHPDDVSRRLSAALTIAPMSARYYRTRAGQRLEDAAPAGEVPVPGEPLAFRSMLPDAQESYALRDSARRRARGRGCSRMRRRSARALVIVSMAPALFWVAGLVREPAAARPALEARSRAAGGGTSLEAARALDLSDARGAARRLQQDEHNRPRTSSRRLRRARAWR